MPAPRAVAQRPSTPPFNFIAGMYQLSRWHIPYLASTMTFRDAAANLRLVSDFPGIERLAWRVEELSREISTGHGSSDTLSRICETRTCHSSSIH